MRFVFLSLLFLASCAHTDTQRSAVLGCEYPPEIEQGFFRAFCQEFPEENTFGCGYIGYNDQHQMCLIILEAKSCGEFKILEPTMCGIGVIVMPPPEASKTEPKQQTPNVSNNYNETLSIKMP